jgi:hypothetical protein
MRTSPAAFWLLSLNGENGEIEIPGLRVRSAANFGGSRGIDGNRAQEVATEV